jgi:carbamoyl-phosphate synthase large subunit
MAAAPSLPSGGNLFVSVKDSDKKNVMPIVKQFSDLGFIIHATDGTAALIKEAGIPVKRLNKLAQGRPNVVDMIKNGEMQFIINTPSGKQPRQDEVVIRSTAVANRIPIMTTLRAAAASASAIQSIAKSPLTVKSLQEHHASTKS